VGEAGEDDAAVVDIGPGNKVWAWLRSTLDGSLLGLNVNGWDAHGLYENTDTPTSPARLQSLA
jgi:hypothetical protein